MATQRTNLEFNTFVKGIVTEAGPLTFPENASLDEKNFVLNRDGSRQRRLGLDYELGYSLNAGTSDTDAVYSTHVWKGAGNDSSVDIAAIQVGDKFQFYLQNNVAVSSTLIDEIDIGGAVTVLASTANLYGKFIIAHGQTVVTVCTYDPVTSSISTEEIAIAVRDTWGVEDGLPVDERPTTDTDTHRYNLYNQGWPREFNCFTNSSGGDEILNAVDNTFNEQDVYPSNADVIWLSKTAVAQTPNNVGAYSSWLLFTNVYGSTQAPRGSAIIPNVFFRAIGRRDAFPGVSGIPDDFTTGHISSVAAYAGRAFYSIKQVAQGGGDTRSPSLGTLIFFSQVANNDDSLGKCYSENDPGAEEFNDPLATDGGFISIPEMGEVFGMEPLGNSLFVFASNGIWEIHGGEGSFSATNQNLAKTSNAGALSTKAITRGDGILGYWSEGGIYVIELDKVSLRGSAQNVTQASIQTLYNDIPAAAKVEATGIYDSIARQVRWMYREGSLTSAFGYNRELIFDIPLGAFYKNEFGILDGDTIALPAGYIDLSSVISAEVVEEVTDSGVLVTDSGDPVTNTVREIQESIKGSTKYLALVYEDATSYAVSKITVAQLREPDFYDWKTIDSVGIDAPAELVTGYWTGGVSNKDKKIISITTHMRRTEQGFTAVGTGYEPVSPSGCLLQGQWAWTDSATSGRWTNPVQIYRLDRYYTPTDVTDNFDFSATVISAREVIDGHGEALSLKFVSEEGKDCHLYGWGQELTVEV